MGTLTGCMRKAGAALNDTDKAAVQGRFNDLTAGGMKPKVAANQALDERMAYLRERLASVESGAEVEPEAEVPTWTDQPADEEPATKQPVVAPEPPAAPEPQAAEVETVTTPAAPTKPPEPPQQTRPERLIELRKRQSVLKQLLECMG